MSVTDGKIISNLHATLKISGHKHRMLPESKVRNCLLLQQLISYIIESRRE
jgi:hypothetical protein